MSRQTNLSEGHLRSVVLVCSRGVCCVTRFASNFWEFLDSVFGAGIQSCGRGPHCTAAPRTTAGRTSSRSSAKQRPSARRHRPQAAHAVGGSAGKQRAPAPWLAALRTLRSRCRTPQRAPPAAHSSAQQRTAAHSSAQQHTAAHSSTQQRTHRRQQTTASVDAAAARRCLRQTARKGCAPRCGAARCCWRRRWAAARSRSRASTRAAASR